MCGGTSVAGPCVLFLLLLVDFLEVLPFAVVEWDIVSRSHVEALDSFRAAGRYCQSTLQLQRRRHTDHVIRRRRISVNLDLSVREWRCTLPAVYWQVDNNNKISTYCSTSCCCYYWTGKKAIDNRCLLCAVWYKVVGHSAVIFCQTSSSLRVPSTATPMT